MHGRGSRKKVENELKEGEGSDVGGRHKGGFVWEEDERRRVGVKWV